MLRKTKWGMIALGALAWACATDGQGSLPDGATGNENPFNSGTERPGGGATETPVNTATEKPCSVSAGDVLGIFDVLCEKVEECGWDRQPNPPVEGDGTEQRVISGYSAADGLRKMTTYLPIRRTLGESSGGDVEIDLFGEVCDAVSECVESGSCGDVSQEVIVDAPVCIGDVLACIRGIFELIPCDGDTSDLENAQLPAACESLMEYEPPPDDNGSGGAGPE